jgi:hypothetical protein
LQLSKERKINQQYLLRRSSEEEADFQEKLITSHEENEMRKTLSRSVHELKSPNISMRDMMSDSKRDMDL